MTSAVDPGPAVTLHPGPVRAEWCPACKAYTVVAGDLLLLTPDGVATVGAWAWCETCEEPAGGPSRG
ncbi:MAG TPA: hypothetical protein VK545_25990 [Streptomyces sp.]|nr:hypothetical protein [Streptomyces sp.]